MFDDWAGAWKIVGLLAQKVLLPVMSLFQVSAEEAGERGLYAARARSTVVVGSIALIGMTIMQRKSLS